MSMVIAKTMICRPAVCSLQTCPKNCRAAFWRTSWLHPTLHRHCHCHEETNTQNDYFSVIVLSWVWHCKMSGKRTRHNSSTAIMAYLGTSRELLPSELPTLRAVFRLALFLRENEDQYLSQISIEALMKKVAVQVVAQYKLANHEFEPPVIWTLPGITQRLLKTWQDVSQVAKGKANKKQKDDLERKLDLIFDIIRYIFYHFCC